MFVGAIGAGVSVSQMPSKSKAEKSATNVFAIIEEDSLIDSRQEGEVKNVKIKEGSIEFKDVLFKYPSRNKYILQGLNIKIEGNQSVALVGHSGSGKSTIASLLLRYYRKQGGKILIDGIDMDKMSVNELRQQIAIVMQEPLLFNEPIKENIRYGNSQATDQEIYQAAEQANCLSFIENNIDALSVPEVKSQIEADFKRLLSTTNQTHPGFKQLSEHQLVIEEVFMLKELMQFASQEGLQLLDQNMNRFLNFLK